MSDSQKMAMLGAMQQQAPMQQSPQQPIGMLAQGTDPQGLPPTIGRMQGGFGLNPQMLGLLQQVSQQGKPAAAPQPSPFGMRPQPVQMARPAYGPMNWSR